MTDRDAAYGYASAYGYAAQQLEFILAATRPHITPEIERINPALWELSRYVARLAESGITSANAALRRYQARIEDADKPAVSPSVRSAVGRRQWELAQGDRRDIS